MNEWLLRQGISSPLTALVIGLLIGLLLAMGSAWSASRRAARRQQERLQPEVDALAGRLEEARGTLAAAEQERAVLETRIADRDLHYREQIGKLVSWARRCV